MSDFVFRAFGPDICDISRRISCHCSVFVFPFLEFDGLSAKTVFGNPCDFVFGVSSRASWMLCCGLDVIECDDEVIGFCHCSSVPFWV